MPEIDSTKKKWLEKLEKLALSKCLELKELPQHLGISSPVFYREIDNNAGPSPAFLARVARFFNLTVDDLIFDNIDFDWLEKPDLPIRYRAKTGSRIRTLLPILHFVRIAHGEELFCFLMNRLKIPYSLLDKPDHFVCLELLNDLCLVLAERGLKAEEFKKMGVFAAKIRENQHMITNFRNEKSRLKIYEKLFDELVPSYELNFDYKVIKASSRSILIKVCPLEERKVDLARDVIDNIWVSYYRQGVAAGHLLFAGYNPAQACLVESPHFGGRDEKISISW